MWESRWEQVQAEMAAASAGLEQQLNEAHNRSAKLEGQLHEAKSKAEAADDRASELQKQLTVLQQQSSKEPDVGSVVQRPVKSVEQQARATGVTSLQVSAEDCSWLMIGVLVKVAELEKARNSMASELVGLTTRNNELQVRCEKAEKRVAETEGLKHHYDMMLEMMGEKSEEVAMLQEEMDEVKQLYHEQINQLTNQIVSLTESK